MDWAFFIKLCSTLRNLSRLSESIHCTTKVANCSGKAYSTDEKTKLVPKEARISTKILSRGMCGE